VGEKPKTIKINSIFLHIFDMAASLNYFLPYQEKKNKYKEERDRQILPHAVASHLEEYIKRLYDLERLLFPQPVFLSSGFVVRESECSICGAEYGECNHIKGLPYMGKLCARIVKEADLQEVSVVSDPADKRCRVLHYTDDGVTRNVFTQRVISKADAQHDAVQDVESTSTSSSTVS
jgi:hypothetical protein